VSDADGLAGDRARVSIVVAVEPADAFEIFTAQIDQWWRRGLKYRVGGNRGILCMEAGIGGRLFESYESDTGPRVVESGRITVWDPPARLAFEWRATSFDRSERTEVEVLFQPDPGGTLVVVTHHGWSRIRPDHPARHGQEVPAFIRTLGLWWADLMTSMRQHAASLDVISSHR
jgi:uncharacterized protein YndB with AHSA1/START domain